MRTNIKTFGLLLGMVFLFSSCEKAENRVIYEGGTAPVLTASASAVALTPPPADESREALRLRWTNPNYMFTTGVSSHDVNYTLEIDVVGNNFNGKNKYTTSISKDLEKSFTILELNAILGNTMLLKFGQNYSLEARIISNLALNAVPLISNKITFTATPYAPPPKVEPPTNGTLWATGNAFASGWSNPLPAPFDASQRFTRVSNTLYELVVDMPGGGNYKLIQEQGVWGTQYHMISGGTWESGTFRKRDAEPGFIGAPSAGRYKITVDFQLGIFTVVKQ